MPLPISLKTNKPPVERLKHPKDYLQLRRCFRRWLSNPTNHFHLDNLIPMMVDYEIKHHLQKSLSQLHQEMNEDVSLSESTPTN